MTLRRVIALAAAAAVTAGASAPPASAADGRCSLRGGRVLLASQQARVLVRPKPAVEGRSVYACLSGRRPAFVGLQTVETSVYALQLEGRWLAYRYSSASSGGVGHAVRLFDLRRGAEVGLGIGTGFRAPFALSPRGVVLIVAAGPPGAPGVEVHAYSGQDRTLDAAAGIDPNSIAVSADGRTGYWTRGGLPQSAALVP